MNPTDVKLITIWEDTGVTVLARIVGNDGVAITRASISSITCKVWDKKTNTNVATPSVVVASAVTDTLQTDDPRWTQDEVGYNFLHTLPATAFPNPAKQYRVGYLFDPATGENFGFGVEVQTKKLLV